MKNPVKNGKENELLLSRDPERYLESEWKQQGFKSPRDAYSFAHARERDWMVEAHSQLAGIRRNIVCFLFLLSLSLLAYNTFELSVAVSFGVGLPIGWGSVCLVDAIKAYKKRKRCILISLRYRDLCNDLRNEQDISIMMKPIFR